MKRSRFILFNFRSRACCPQLSFFSATTRLTSFALSLHDFAFLGGDCCGAAMLIDAASPALIRLIDSLAVRPLPLICINSPTTIRVKNDHAHQTALSNVHNWRNNMLRLVSVAFLVAVASPAYALPRAPVQQPESLITAVREACGAGMHRVNGVCVRTPARRQAARCAAGLRYVNGRCIR